MRKVSQLWKLFLVGFFLVFLVGGLKILANDLDTTSDESVTDEPYFGTVDKYTPCGKSGSGTGETKEDCEKMALRNAGSRPDCREGYTSVATIDKGSCSCHQRYGEVFCNGSMKRCRKCQKN